MKQVLTIFHYFSLHREGHAFYEKPEETGDFKQVNSSPTNFGLISDMIAEKSLWYKGESPE